jgi:crotonobetainyl-CoA:carnitine CoA-transferase CaiB-like acyl-CoA transferase
LIKRDRVVFDRLVESADVLVHNYQTRVVDKLDLSYQTLSRLNPGIVVVAITGYGSSGPNAERPALGMSMEAASGIASLTGYSDGPPMKTGQTWADPYTGLHAAGAAILGLIERMHTGRGQAFDISMQEVCITALGRRLDDYLASGSTRKRAGNRRPGMVRGAYRCSGNDEWIAVSARSESEWRALCMTIGTVGWLTDPRFITADARDANHDLIDEAITAWTAPRLKREAAHVLRTNGVAAAPVLKAHEILQDPQLIAREFFDLLEVQDYGSQPLQRYFTPKFDGAGFAPCRTAPGLNEHAEELLHELGIRDGHEEIVRSETPHEREPAVVAAERDYILGLLAQWRELGSILAFEDVPSAWPSHARSTDAK